MGILLLSALLAAGCAHEQALLSARGDPAPMVNVQSALPLLAYYELLAPLDAAELAGERDFLATLPAEPTTQIRLAMLIAHPHSTQDVAKALALVKQVLRSNEPTAVKLHGLARLLADQYEERQRLDNERLRLDGERQRLDGERQRLEGQLDRQGTQLKDSQRKARELQDKLDRLADIERTLTPQPRAGQGGAP
ncbi:MAG: permease [Betaproteobacteria bacterium]|nr:permease [Betaproteobacteria bacterium]MCL2887214.1 permease [Betaproteobacteria bacterium]